MEKIKQIVTKENITELLDTIRYELGSVLLIKENISKIERITEIAPYSLNLYKDMGNPIYQKNLLLYENDEIIWNKTGLIIKRYDQNKLSSKTDDIEDEYKIVTKDNIDKIKEKICDRLCKEKNRMINIGISTSFEINKIILPLDLNIDDMISCNQVLHILELDTHCTIVNRTTKMFYSNSKFSLDNMIIPDDINGNYMIALSKFITSMINRAKEFKIYNNEDKLLLYISEDLLNKGEYNLPKKIWMQPKDSIIFKNNVLSLNILNDNVIYKFIL